MPLPKWMYAKFPNPGKPNFRAAPAERSLATSLGGERRPLSGAGDAKYDVASIRWLADSKETSKRSYAITSKQLQDLAGRANIEGRRPMHSLVFWEDEKRGEEWVIIRMRDLLELTQGASNAE